MNSEQILYIVILIMNILFRLFMSVVLMKTYLEKESFLIVANRMTLYINGLLLIEIFRYRHQLY